MKWMTENPSVTRQMHIEAARRKRAEAEAVREVVEVDVTESLNAIARMTRRNPAEKTVVVLPSKGKTA